MHLLMCTYRHPSIDARPSMPGTTFPVKVRSGSPRRLGEGEGGEVSLSGARAFMNGEKGFALGRYRDWISYGWAAKRRPTNESNNVGSPDAATTSGTGRGMWHHRGYMQPASSQGP